MPRLSVNVDHIASLRQARAAGVPDPVQAAVIVELAGADGITIHLRQDRRHITDRDAALIRQIVHANLTVEMSPTQEMVDMEVLTARIFIPLSAKAPKAIPAMPGRSRKSGPNTATRATEG